MKLQQQRTTPKNKNLLFGFRAVKIFAVSLLCCALFLLGTVGLAGSLIAEGTLKYFSAQIKKKYQLSINYESVEFSGFSKVSIRKLQIVTLDQKSKFFAKAINVHISIWSYLSTSFPVDRVELVEPNFFVDIGGNESNKFPDILSKLKYLEIIDGVLHAKKNEQELILNKVNLLYYYSTNQHYALLQTDNSQIKLKQKWHPVKEFSFELQFPKTGFFRKKSIHIAELKVDLPELVLKLTGELKKYKPELGWQFNGYFAFSRIKISNFSMDSVSGELVINKNFIEAEHVEVDFAATKIWTSARALLTDKIPFAMIIEGQSISLYDLLTQIDINDSWIELGIDLRAEASGHLLPEFSLEANANGQVYDLTVSDGPARNDKNSEIVIKSDKTISIETRIFVDKNSFTFKNLYLNDDFTHGEINCDLFFKAKRGLILQGSFPQIDLVSINNIINEVNYVGKGGADLEISGPYENLIISGKSIFSNVFVNNFGLGNLNGDYFYHNNLLTFKINHANMDKSVYHGELDFIWSSNLEMKLNIDFENADFADLRAAIPKDSKTNWLLFARKLDLYGPVSGQINLHGPINQSYPRKLAGDIMLDFLPGVNLFDESIHFGSVKIHVDDDFIYLDKLQLNSLSGNLNGTGKFDKYSAELGANFDIEQFNLSWINKIVPFDYEVQGTSNISVQMSGAFDNLVLNANLHAFNVALSSMPVGDADLSLFLRNDNFFIQGAVLSNKGFVDINWGMGESMPISGKFNWQYMSLDPFLQQIELLKHAQLYAGGELNFYGNTSGNKNINGSLKFFPATVFYGGMKLLATGPIETSFKDNLLNVERGVLQTVHGDSLRVKGWLTKDDLNLKITAKGSLSVLPLINERIETAYGDFYAYTNLIGSLNDPKAEGKFTIDNGYVLLRDYSAAMNAVKLIGIVSNHQLIIDSFSGQVQEGFINAKGSIDFKHYLPEKYQLSLEFDNLPIVTRWAIGSSNGKLKLLGKSDELLLSGEILISDALISKNYDFENFYKEFNTRSRLVDTRKKNSKPLKFDINFKGDREIRIENDNLNAALELDLNLIGTMENPGLKGMVNASFGEVYFRNHSYRMIKGKAYFDNAYRIYPRVDLELEGKISEYEINAQLAGYLDKPNFQLRSQPSLSEVDILSLITMGFVGREAKNLLNTARVASLEALSAYSGLGQTLIRLLPDSHNNSKWFHLDEVKLTSLFSHETGANLPALMVGVNLLDGVRLRLHSALVENDNGSREQSVELEHRLNKRMRWHFTWDSEGYSNYGDAGVDLWYRLEL